MHTVAAGFGLALAVVLTGACASDGGSTNHRSTFGGVDRNTGLRVPEDDGGRCPTKEGLVEESMDTSGDNVADVRKVFRVEGEGRNAHKILVCRSLDLNHDGRKDIYRFYNDEGRPLRELTDSNFDGTIDSTAFFEDGRLAREEIDRNQDGTQDETRHFIRGKLLRVERDDNYDSKTDVWEHWEDGRLLRIGYDVNADEVADFWHRAPSMEEDEEEPEPAAGGEGEGDTPAGQGGEGDEGGDDSEAGTGDETED
jgi:hypothetical protein